MVVVTPDNQSSKQPSDQKLEDLEEPPPSYSPQTELAASTSSPLPPTFKTKPTNFLALATGDSTIRGEFIIDPSINIPSSMLPPLGDGETEDDRKNLSLRSKHSSVHAEIWLLGSSAPAPLQEESAIGAHKSRRTTIALASDHGSIRAELQHTLEGAAPFLLTARAPHGSVRLAVPRSFQGLLSLSTRNGGVSVSDALIRNATQLSQVGNTRRYFVGNFQALGEEEWGGDQVEIETPHGSIRIKYVDEAAEAQGKKGLFARLFAK